MTGISKNFFKFSSLLAVVALFLGLMVTGCSEGDSTPAHVDFDTDSADLDIIVGVADPAAKGFDVDTNVDTLALRLLDATGKAVGEDIEFDDVAAEGVEAWTVLDDGALLMSTNVAAENVEKVAAVVVAAYDKDYNLLGCYVDDAVTLTAGTKTTLNFTADDAPAFIPVTDLVASAELTLTTVPEAVDGLVTIAVGDIATVTAVVNVALTENLTIEYEVAAEDLVLTAESTDINIDDAKDTITGMNATTADVVVSASTTEGPVTLTSMINVKVTGPEPVSELNAIKVVLKDTPVPTDATGWDALESYRPEPKPSVDTPIALAVIGRFGVDGNYTYDYVTDVTYESNYPEDCPVDDNGVVTLKPTVSPSFLYVITAKRDELSADYEISIS